MTDEEVLRLRKKNEDSVVLKLTLGLLPFLALLYMFNILDRGNVSIAALKMPLDLHFKDNVYPLGAGIFFIGYFLFEVPSNIIMEKVGARRWIARIMITWGIISSCMMFVNSPISFYSLRFLLGVAEAGFYPGIILYFTYWVPGTVRAQIIGRFLAMSAILGLLGGPIGGMLLNLDGFQHLKGWQWLFLLEGLPSILLGFVVLMVLPNRPGDTNWLTNEEKEWIQESLAREDKNLHRVHHPSFHMLISNPRILLMCLIFFITSTGGNAVGFFGPQLIKARSNGLWSDPFVAFIGVIPSLVGAIAMTVAVWHSDRSGKRRKHVVIGYFIAGLGFLACVYAPTAPLILVAMSVNILGERIAAGSYWALTANLMGARAAAGGIAFINSVGNLGGFAGPNLMGFLKERTHGGYTAGLYTAAALMIAGSLLSILLRRHPDASSNTGISTEDVPVIADSQSVISQ